MQSPYPALLFSWVIIAAVAMCVSSCENEISEISDNHTDTAVDLHLKVTLTQSSTVPTLDQISPYEEALIINEYQIVEVFDGKKPDSDKIRIAQWAITNKQNLPLATQQGTMQTLYLTPLSSMPELNSVYQRNDLGFDPEEKIYYDLTPIPEDYTPPKNLRHDYRSDITRRLKVYWLIRHQLKLAVLGNSHSAAAVDPELFYQPGNTDVPVALNLSPAGSGIEFQSLLADQYLANLPRLEWVIWGISPRIFNQNYAIDRRAQLFQKSPGYLYDQQHWQQLINKTTSAKPATFDQIRETLDSKLHPWGWAKRETRDFAVPLPDDTRKAMLKKCRNPQFTWNNKAWLRFRKSVEKLAQSKIKVLLFTPPYHPLVADTAVVDGDDTGKADYARLVEKLKILSERFSSVHFLDIHQSGHHEFKHEHFSDIDHLHISGAKLLTERLVKFIEKN